MLETVLAKLASCEDVTLDDLTYLLDLSEGPDLQALFRAAYDVKRQNVGSTVFFRGIIEYSNICTKDCHYCGIRRGNRNVDRYEVSLDEVARGAKWAHDAGYGSIVLQGGERSDAGFVDRITAALDTISETTNGELGVTLSLGEQTRDTYRRWYRAGGHRYLLRIETTNQDIYRSMHPDDHDWDTRFACLNLLRDEGYQVGTGVMMGLPGQTTEDLARDLMFFKDWDVDMIGMGPFIPHDDTPMAYLLETFNKDTALDLGLKMIACARLLLRDVNIAATTALEALEPTGRELGLQAGANIIMPNITDTRYRKAYQLYRGKPGTNENSDSSRSALQDKIESIGEDIGFGRWGDSPHYKKRKG